MATLTAELRSPSGAVAATRTLEVADSSVTVPAPPPRDRVVENAPPGTMVAPGNFYLNPQGSLSYPVGVSGVTVLGGRTVTTILKGVRDVHIEGYPDRWMESGPRSDGGDLLQVKRSTAGGQVPEDVTIRYWHLRDVTRPGNEHPDGVQVMAGRRLMFADCRADRVNVQPFYARDAGHTAAGGPIEDLTFLRCEAVGQTEGFYTFRIAGNVELIDPKGDPAGPVKPGRYVPTRVRIIDCGGDKNVAMDAACRVRGGVVSGWRSL